MPKRRHEPTQPGNPHELPIAPHVHSRWCVSQFADERGHVSVLRRANLTPFPANPGNEIFCALRGWDQKAERILFKKIEDAFHAEVREVSSRGAVENHEAVSKYLAAWEVRVRFKETPQEDVELAVAHEPRLTKDQEEILETYGLAFTRGNVMPGRFFSGALAVKFIDQLMARYGSLRWGLSHVDALTGLICSDRPTIRRFIPIGPKLALVAGRRGLTLRANEVERLNQESWMQAREFIFGHPDDVHAFSSRVCGPPSRE